MRRSNLKRHLETRHTALAEKPSALKASFLVARRVALTKKAFTIAEELLLPFEVDMCREMIGEDAAKKT